MSSEHCGAKTMWYTVYTVNRIKTLNITKAQRHSQGSTVTMQYNVESDSVCTHFTAIFIDFI